MLFCSFSSKEKWGHSRMKRVKTILTNFCNFCHFCHCRVVLQFQFKTEVGQSRMKRKNTCSESEDDQTKLQRMVSSIPCHFSKHSSFFSNFSSSLEFKTKELDTKRWEVLYVGVLHDFQKQVLQARIRNPASAGGWGRIGDPAFDHLLLNGPFCFKPCQRCSCPVVRIKQKGRQICCHFGWRPS